MVLLILYAERDMFAGVGLTMGLVMALISFTAAGVALRTSTPSFRHVSLSPSISSWVISLISSTRPVSAPGVVMMWMKSLRLIRVVLRCVDIGNMGRVWVGCFRADGEGI